MLTFLQTVLLVVGFAFTQQYNQSLISEKFNSIILLQAFGDALGAPNEIYNFKNFSSPENQKCTLRNVSKFYNETMYPNTWFIWPPPSKIKNTFGVFTDDTSQRLANFYGFLSNYKKSPLEFKEYDYIIWKKKLADNLFSRSLKEPNGIFL